MDLDMGYERKVKNDSVTNGLQLSSVQLFSRVQLFVTP